MSTFTIHKHSFAMIAQTKAKQKNNTLTILTKTKYTKNQKNNKLFK